MKGPTPKDPAIRRRANKKTTAAILTANQKPRTRAPTLPDLRDWQQMTRRWWHDVWHSPMAVEFLESDLNGLVLLAMLIDEFWIKPTTAKAAEIRLQGQNFGLSPLDRRRLEWQVVQNEELKDKREANQARRAKVVKDPRAVLE